MLRSYRAMTCKDSAGAASVNIRLTRPPPGEPAEKRWTGMSALLPAGLPKVTPPSPHRILPVTTPYIHFEHAVWSRGGYGVVTGWQAGRGGLIPAFSQNWETPGGLAECLPASGLPRHPEPASALPNGCRLHQPKTSMALLTGLFRVSSRSTQARGEKTWVMTRANPTFATGVR